MEAVLCKNDDNHSHQFSHMLAIQNKPRGRNKDQGTSLYYVYW